MRKILFNLLSKIFLAYLKLISLTCKLEIKNEDRIRENTMLGYWHGDSYCMQLVLKHISKRIHKIDIIVTADRRGDAIEGIISYYGANAIRLPDGLGIRHFMRDLKELSRNSEGILAASLDGPLGPVHEPKRLLFLLAAEGDKELVYIHFKYKNVIRLRHRWDNYVIPLPFSRITAEVEEIGSISKEDLRDFSKYREKLKC